MGCFMQPIFAFHTNPKVEGSVLEGRRGIISGRQISKLHWTAENYAKPAASVHPIHFEDFDGSEFERLVFAYHWRSDDWHSLEWYGQAGSDLGRDIWGVRANGTTDGESVCIQCVNRSQLTFAKAEQDIAKVLTAPNGVPHRFRIVAQAKISAEMRDRIKAHVRALGVEECDTWSGPEFEEFLRKGAESLLSAFAKGKPFPMPRKT